MPSHPFHHMTLLLALIGGISSCSSPGVVTLNDKTQYSDVIVAGTISSKVRDGVYSMLVDCVLKDSNVDIPASLNISGVGKFEDLRKVLQLLTALCNFRNTNRTRTSVCVA